MKKNKMINAIDVACELQGLLPASQRPQFTEGYEGFYHCVGLNGTVENASVSYIIRDHDAKSFEARKALFLALASEINRRYGEGTAEAEITDTYYNMRDRMEPHRHLLDRAEAAYRACGVTPRTEAIRGGTDGARLSYMGLPCPNLFTGGMNFHGKFEYCSVDTMQRAVQTIINLARIWSES